MMRYLWEEAHGGHYAVSGPFEQCQEAEVVAASDYDALAAARQHEFAYIEKVLKACSKATASDIRDELRDLRAWAANRSTCFPAETKVVCPDWGGYHNFNAGRCSCGESNAQTYVDRGTKP